ncbi:MAG: winged helix-turn-helix domain-containing protein, partial [Candidatus Pacebacteria bacterium]|nr:winged helix-turn-helix domain-containing protein [Candidatus Paceibacterota bacterium]
MYSKTEAAYKILKESKKPLHVADIIKIALDKKLIKTKGKTPESTLAVDLLLENRR